MTVYNEIPNMEEMWLTIQPIRDLLGTIYFKNHNILCMVVQIVQETLEDVPRDESTNVKADSMITVQNGHFSEQKTGGTGNSSSFQ